MRPHHARELRKAREGLPARVLRICVEHAVCKSHLIFQILLEWQKTAVRDDLAGEHRPDLITTGERGPLNYLARSQQGHERLRVFLVVGNVQHVRAAGRG